METIRYHVDKFSDTNREVVDIFSSLYVEGISCGTYDLQKAFAISI